MISSFPPIQTACSLPPSPMPPLARKHYLQLPLLFPAILLFFPLFSSSFPLSSSSRWIVDDSNGSRVKLACVNWVSHLKPMLAEGLSKQPLDNITSTVKAWGFNCVRLTWATFMFTNTSLGQQTVNQTFTSLNLSDALAGIAKHNPEMVEMPVVEAYKAVVSSLGRNGLMVVLDNQMSEPGWCCSDNDGNGFWGDKHFDPDVWVQGLRIVASTFRGSPHVVAMSLRNEPRGPRQNIPDWYKYMQMGADTVHSENPNLLVVHSGLSYALNLRFLSSQPINETCKDKIVYEVHWYSFTNGDSYTVGNLNDKCASISAGMMNGTGFLSTPNMSFTGPLFISEFGVDQTGLRENDNRFIPCFFAFAAGGDFDWAYWSLQGSYYLRQGQRDLEELYGIMNSQWDAPRNLSFLKRLQALQLPFVQDVNSPPYQSIFHPASGLCVQKASITSLILGSCRDSLSHWSYSPHGEIALKGTYLIIAADGEGQPAVLKVAGTELNGPWDNTVSESGLQFSTRVANTTVCLDGSSPPAIVTNKCICTQHTGCSHGADPSGQWFKFVTSSSSSK